MKDDLDQLLEAERRLASRLEEARTSAARLLELARVDARALAAHAEEEAQAGTARIETQTKAELEVELQHIAALAEARVRRYQAVTAPGLEDLALFVLRSLVEDVPAVGP
ncbi:MAG: V-type ATPase subunit subunit G family protein [Myxococcaceae bacterium]